jgi:hypothetical protein
MSEGCLLTALRDGGYGRGVNFRSSLRLICRCRKKTMAPSREPSFERAGFAGRFHVGCGTSVVPWRGDRDSAGWVVLWTREWIVCGGLLWAGVIIEE